jgi:hypothetical protein
MKLCSGCFQKQLFNVGKIYFVKTIPNNIGTVISGLLERIIGDTIIVRKGRFDFYVSKFAFLVAGQAGKGN